MMTSKSRIRFCMFYILSITYVFSWILKKYKKFLLKYTKLRYFTNKILIQLLEGIFKWLYPYTFWICVHYRITGYLSSGKYNGCIVETVKGWWWWVGVSQEPIEFNILQWYFCYVLTRYLICPHSFPPVKCKNI